MRRLYISILMVLLATVSLMAQPKNRLPKTIVADVLAQMPAQNMESFNALMGDLASIPAEAVEMLTAMKTPIGVSDNSKIDFALGGLTSYVTSKDGASSREAVCKAYITALGKAKEWEVKAFIVRQLQAAGDEESIETLKNLCSSNDLYTEAAHALQSIGSKSAIDTLRSSIDVIAAKDKAVAAKIIADNSLSGYQTQLISWLGSDCPKQQKAVLSALAATGDVAAIKPLEAAAAAVKYDFDPTGALEAYMVLVAKQNDADKHLAKIFKSKPSLAAMQRAISIIANNKGKAALPYIIEAVGGNCSKYRAHALKEFAPYACSVEYGKILSAATTPRAKADILYWDNCNKKEELALALESIKSSDAELFEAAAKVLSRDGGKVAVAALCSLFGDSNANACKAAYYLTATKGDVAVPSVKAFEGATKNGKLAIMKLWENRRISEGAYLAKKCIGGDDSDLDLAARSAMTAISTPIDLADLYKMLPDSKNLGTTQAAIVNAASFYCKDKAYDLIKSQMDNDSNNRDLYFAILAGINNPAAISVIEDALDSDNAKLSAAAAEALSQWKGIEALTPLYKVASESKFAKYSDKAIKKYVELVDGNKAFTDQMKYINLRKIAEVTKSDENMNMILDNMAWTNSFGALIFAGKYIDNPATEQAACHAVMRLAASNKEFCGEEVKTILNKFLAKRKGQDAGYEKENVSKIIKNMPQDKGFEAIFNGKDLSGWKGLVENPIERSKMDAKKLAAAQVKADEVMRKGWKVDNGVLYFTGDGDNLCTEKPYGNFEMYVDWKIEKDGDAGIYLRGTPQVQIWDTCRVDVGAEVGSGGLYNNQKNPSKPTKLADNHIGDWNTFYIKMVGERVTVYLNGEKVVDNTILENYWDRSLPIFPIEQLELQAHGTLVGYRDIYVRELPETKTYDVSDEEKKEGFRALFDGVSMNQWTGNTQDYVAEDGNIALYPSNNHGGNLYTKDEFGNFIFRFEFCLTPGANNGLGIRTPMNEDAAYAGMELQILDNEDPVYKDLAVYQYHGSVYGVIPAKRGFLKPVGEWNSQEVIANGNHIKITLNGEVILDGDIYEASKGGKATADGQNHPGLLNKKGYIGFLGHGSELKFRNIRIKELK